MSSARRPNLTNAKARASERRSPEELYNKIVNNEPDWQKEAFDEYHELVYRLVLKSLGPAAEVDEVLDDIFLSFFESAHRIRASAKMRSYVVSITMNRIRHEIRKRKRHELFQRLMGKAEEIDHRAGNDDPKAKAALIQLDRILGELDGDERSAFLLRSLEGMAYVEIAEALSISESTALRWTRRATEHVMKRVGRNALLCDYIRERSS